VVTARPLRVAVWGTGDVGHYVLRGVLQHPGLELVGVRVWHEDKAGRDVGELIGWDDVGVVTTTSTDEVLALRPDCLIHAAPSRVVEPVAEFLAAGTDVVSLCSASLVHPPSAPAEVREPLASACASGGSTLFYGGIDPGFAAHTLPITLSAICERIDLLVSYEVRDYDPLPLHQLDWFNFGRTTTEGARFFTPGGISGVWAAPLQLIAQALGVTLERIEEFHEVALAEHDFEVPAMAVPAGTIAAVRFGLRGIVDGVERLRIEHVNRLHRDLAPEWEQRQGYGVHIEGAPRYHLHLDLEDPAGMQTRPALWGTAMYMVNAVPAVVAAPPGIATVLDLPIIRGATVGGEDRAGNWTLSERILRGETRKP
jgi:4-hydroxy-tetrahydrodipicolinate reductase